MINLSAKAKLTCALAFWLPTALQAQAIHRLAANFKNFDGTETSTAAAVPGISAFKRTVLVPAADNVLYVTISLTADQHKGNGEFFSCNVDGAFCNPGSGGAGGAPAGWITLGKHFNYDLVSYNGGNTAGDGGGGTGDMHDNSVHYTWCTPVVPGVHTIEVRLASSLTGGGAGSNNNVYFEAAHFFIDSSMISKSRDACGGAPRDSTSTPGQD